MSAVSPPGHRPLPTDPRAALAEIRALEARLARFGRDTDRSLRRAFGSLALARLLRLRTAPPRAALRRLAWAPAAPVLALGVAGLLLGLAAALLPLPGDASYRMTALPGSWRSLLAAAAVVLLALAVLGLWAERQILPVARLAAYRFRLMRLEREEPAGEHPALFRSTGLEDSPDGFGWQSWRAIGGLAPGDLVVAVVDRHGEAVASVLPRFGGTSPVLLWRLGQWVADALPAAPAALGELAAAFDRACEDHDALLEWRRQHDQNGRLRSGMRAGEDEARRIATAWDGVALPADTRQRLRDAAEALRRGDALAPRGVLLHGPPGTGKSLAAKALGEAAGSTLFTLSPADLKAGHLGAGAARVRDLWRSARAAPRAVIVVDECDALFARRGSLESDTLSEEVLAAFLAAWDGLDKGGRVTVVGTTNRRDRLDPALLSRFELDVAMPLPDTGQRAALLEGALSRHGLGLADTERAALDSAGLSGRDLDAVARELARRHEGDGTRLAADAVEAALAAHRRRSAMATTSSTDLAGWDRLVLAEPVLRDLKAMAGLLRHAAAFRTRGIEPPRGLLLWGPPGTGKTQIARTLAQESGLGFIGLTTAELKQGYVGQSGQKVREAFQRAREAAPCVLFIDEIDALSVERGGAQDAFQAEITGQLLQEMDGIHGSDAPVFVLAATNRREALDAALLSRFPRQLAVGLPDAAARERLLRVMLQGKPLAFDLEVALPDWAALTEGRSGRDLRSWIEAAELSAVARAMDAGRPEDVALAIGDFPRR